MHSHSKPWYQTPRSIVELYRWGARDAGSVEDIGEDRMRFRAGMCGCSSWPSRRRLGKLAAGRESEIRRSVILFCRYKQCVGDIWQRMNNSVYFKSRMTIYVANRFESLMPKDILTRVFQKWIPGRKGAKKWIRTGPGKPNRSDSTSRWSNLHIPSILSCKARVELRESPC